MNRSIATTIRTRFCDTTMPKVYLHMRAKNQCSHLQTLWLRKYAPWRASTEASLDYLQPFFPYFLAVTEIQSPIK
jgi:hypothetical protein